MFASNVRAAPPDLTSAGVIATIDRSATYNLGATGLRGWIWIDTNNAGADGLQTAQSRQILVTVASTPASAVLAVDDVILGAMAGSSGTVPAFTSDCRKSFGVAIGAAENAGAGSLRVKRWRAGTTTDVNIPMTIMGNYTATAPYTCPKSALILANARTKLVSQLLANESILPIYYSGGINGLALLAGVTPADANYAAVQTRLQTFARACANTPPNPSGLYIWHWSYISLFLAEYYLSTGDTQVVAGLNTYIVALAKTQSRYGTFGHFGSLSKADGSLHGTIPPYGALNQAGLPANLAIVLGKKALLAAGQVLDPEIDPAIQRGSDFFAYFVNKGSIPYGEHEPWLGGHASNGKDALCAVLFGLQTGRPVETEYFTRMSVAGFSGREYGHAGQGFSYIWGAMGANMGGSLAAAEYLKNVRWHLDLSRRTDGSFAYDGAEQYGPGSTTDGTYLGESPYDQVNTTANYILTYSLPLQRLYIGGKNANPANTLDASKVANAIAAATFNQDAPGFTTTQLLAALSEFDPVVRNYAAIELAKRTLATAELTTLRSMISGSDANGRMGACQALGILKDATALPMITQRLDKTVENNSWVRAKAASAIRSYPPAAASAQLTPMLTDFTANATDPEVIVWDDPLQFANGYLSYALFGDAYSAGMASYTIDAPKSLLYPAVKAALKQPDGLAREGPASFCYNLLTLPDVQALIPDLIEVAAIECQANTMFSMSSRASGINTLAKWHISEGIPVALAMLDVPKGFTWGSPGFTFPALNALVAYGDASRWTLPVLRGYIGLTSTAQGGGVNEMMIPQPELLSTISTIESAITAPALLPGFAVAESQVVATTGAKAITLTGTSPRTSVTFANVTAPAHGTLTGTAPNLIYTPTAGYTGPDSFTFQTTDDLTTSAPGTVSIIVGTAGTGLKAEYYDNANFTNLKLTRTDAQVNFDWGTGSPDALLGADTFSVRWSGLLLVPETGSYTFSTLNSDGVRLYINGVPVIDDYTDQATNWIDSNPIHLAAGQMVELQMEYNENTGSAVAKLKWTGPSFAAANGAVIGTQWLFDGSSSANRTPFAHAQSVTLLQNTPQALTLQGSGGVLTYSVATQPAHGTLTGTAPNLTYTPAANFSGTDSFTFLVNNGTTNSTPATVSIDIWAGLPVNFTWLNATSGNWSAAGNWTSGTPGATGQPYYNLNFTPAGTYTATHDLNNGFQLNQLNVAGAVTIAGANRLTFAANGPILPQFNQNSANAVSINSPVSLAAMTRFGGNGSGTVTITSLISGSGGLTKDGPSTLTIQNATNTYSGGTVINNGILTMDTDANAALGTGPVTLNGGFLYLYRINATNSLTVNGGKFHADGGWGGNWGGPVTLNADLTVSVPYFDRVTFNGNISGVGGLIVQADLVVYANNGVILTGTNTYTGGTSVTSGLLTCSNSAALGTGSLDIATGAKVALNYTGTRTIGVLTFNAGMPMAPGTYGSTASPATNKNDTYFTGTGTVTAGPPNSPPAATSQNINTAEDFAKPITLSATDVNSNPLTYAILSQPAHGTLSGTPPNVTYAPVFNYNGVDSFTFKANDGNIDSEPATISITITAVNDAPIAIAQSVSTAEDSAKAITLAGADAENSTLAFANVTPPAHGTLSGTPPNVTYTPTADYSGPDSFSFKVNDGTFDSAAATVTIAVTEFVPPPIPTCQLGILDVANANGGINPATGNPWALGDTYRLIFVTSTNTTATSTDIATYNAFVQSLADAAGLGSSALGPVTWKVVGSTATVAARDNTGTNPGVNGVGQPILRMDGTFVIANSYVDLWNGINNTHVTAQNYLSVQLDEKGAERLDDRVRTGSNANGTAADAAMFGASVVQTGRNFAPDSYGALDGNRWLADWSEPAASAGRVYAMSGILTIISTTPTDPYQIWLGEFTFAPGYDTTPTGDSDGDGMSNQEEFAFGLNPTLGSSVNPITQQLAQATGVFKYTRTEDSGLTYKVYYSTTLSGWTWDAAATQSPAAAVAGVETVTVTLAAAAPASGKLFVRVEATPMP